MKTYLKFALRLMAGMYILLALTAFIHECGHALAAVLLKETVYSITIGTGPVLANIGIFHFRAFLSGGATLVRWSNSSPAALSFVELGGTLATLLTAGLMFILAECFHGKKRWSCLAASLMLLIITVSNLIPVGYTDGSLLAEIYPWMNSWIVTVNLIIIGLALSLIFFILVFGKLCPVHLSGLKVKPSKK